MKRYTVAQVRERLSAALDAAAAGSPVLIERRGVRFLLSVDRPARPRTPATGGITTLDPAIDAGDWSWTWASSGLTFKGGRKTRA